MKPWKRPFYRKEWSEGGTWLTADGPVVRPATFYYVRRLSFRNWLIRKLVGKQAVALNLRIRGQITVDRPSLLCDNRFE